jgi:hypothetical protein
LARAHAHLCHPSRCFGKDRNRPQRLPIADDGDAVGDLAFAGGQGGDRCRRARAALTATPAAALCGVCGAGFFRPTKAEAVPYTGHKDSHGEKPCDTQR